MNKKGVEISINVIIVAAIALAVLVVLFMIFTGRLGMFSRGVSETTTCNQACIAAGNEKGTPITTDNECTAPSTILLGYYSTERGIKEKCCCTPK